MNIKIISVRLKFKLLKKLGLEHFIVDLLGIMKSKPLIQYNGLHFFSLDEKKRSKEKSSQKNHLSRVFWPASPPSCRI